MSKKTKKWLIIASFLLGIGCIIFGGTMTMLKWDFSKLNTEIYETNIREITENFNNISINTDTANITFKLSENEKCKIECFEEINAKHLIEIKNDTISINKNCEKAWYEHIGINFNSPKITVYLPKKEYSSLKIKESTGNVILPDDFKFDDVDVSLSTGNITAKNLSANKLKLSISTGKVNITNTTCKNLISNGTTGHITLKNVIASEKISIKRNTGNIEFENSDAAELEIKTTTGFVKGTLLSNKNFITKTSTGNIKTPTTATGGKCEITTSTGDIEIDIK